MIAVYETMLSIAFAQTAAESAVLKTQLTQHTRNIVEVEPSATKLPDMTTVGANEESQGVSASGEQPNTKPA